MEITLRIKNLQTKESPGLDSFTGEFYQTLILLLLPMLLKFLQKIEEEGTHPPHFMRPALS